MTTIFSEITVSPVEIENRKNLGLRAGDTVRVHQKIKDKGKIRIQIFEGVVLARKHGDEPGATFTVRKVVDGIGVEKIYPLYTPMIDKIEIIKRSKVRRSKLYHIREKVMREVKRQMRRMKLVSIATESEAEVAARKEVEAAEISRKAEEAARAAEKAQEEVLRTEEKISESSDEGEENSETTSPEGETSTSEEQEKTV